MKLRTLASLLLALTAAPALIQAQDASPAAPAHPKKEKTPLEKQMSKIGKAVRALKKQVGDATQNASSLELVATIHDAAQASLALVPAKSTGLPDADKAKLVSAYKTAMNEFIATVDQLAAALKAGNNAEAAKIFPKLMDLEKKDHHEFRKPEKKTA